MVIECKALIRQAENANFTSIFCWNFEHYQLSTDIFNNFDSQERVT